MKCRLCDRPTAAGTGKLCTDCAKALQRARGAALGKLPPSPAPEMAAATPITLSVAPPSAAKPRSSRTLLWAGVGLVAIALVYVAQQQIGDPRGAEAPGAKRSPSPSMTERVNVEPSPVVTKVEEPSWTTVGDSAKAAPADEAAQSPAVASATKGPVPAAGAKTGAKIARAASADAKPMPLPLPAEYDGNAPKPAEPEPQQQLAGGKVAAPVQPVDGAQVLASAMQKCGNEGVFSKFICEQKTYLQYCEDKWDKDPKCVRKVGER